MNEGMKLRTEIELRPAERLIDHETPIMLMGSCFTDVIGNHLEQAGFTTLKNPFGILYNPLSILACVDHIANRKHLIPNDLILHEGRYHSMLCHGSMSHESIEETLQAINESIDCAHEFLQQDNLQIFITLGTSWVYEKQGQIVGNCHRLPEQQFTRRRLSLEECTTALHSIQEHIKNLASITYTVSPIRHVRDGLHENQLSKSTLLLAIEQAQANYFPAYELLMDDLRDYRFYRDDLCHPSELAADYVWQKFQDRYMTAHTQQICRIREKEWKTKHHV